MIDMGDSDNSIDIIRNNLRGTRHMCGVEVGVHRGALSKQLLESFPDLILAMVDPWKSYEKDDPYFISGDSCAMQTRAQQVDNYKAACEATEEMKDRRLILKLTSEAAFNRIPWKKIDFVFLDGDHTFDAVAKDIASWWKKVRPGGLLMGHDYGHPACRTTWGVDKAVDEFASRENLPLTIDGTCWWVKKGD